MDDLIRRWMWRFLALATVVTLVLSVATGAILAAFHQRPAPWFGVLVVVIGVMVSAGGILPAVQHDMKRRRMTPPPEPGSRKGDP